MTIDPFTEAASVAANERFGTAGNREVWMEAAAWARAHLAAQEPSGAVHFIDLVIQGGAVEHRFRCTATPDAPCRRRPPDADGRESWTAEEATEAGHDCWALDWIEATGIGLALFGEDQTLATAPVSIAYDEGVEVDLLQPHPTLPAAQEPTDAESIARKNLGDDAVDRLAAHFGVAQEPTDAEVLDLIEDRLHDSMLTRSAETPDGDPITIVDAPLSEVLRSVRAALSAARNAERAEG